MAEATHTSEAIYGLKKAVGRGPRLWAGSITVSDSETIDTGLDTIEGIAAISVEATAIDAATNWLFCKSVSGGTITFLASEIDTYGNATDMVAYLIVAGVSRGL